MDWENVTSDGLTLRLSVPGGWLYSIWRYDGGQTNNGYTIAQVVFVPHPPAPQNAVIGWPGPYANAFPQTPQF